MVRRFGPGKTMGLLVLLAAAASGCKPQPAKTEERGEYYEPIQTPPTPPGSASELSVHLQPLPEVGEFDRDKVTLGRRLFHDPGLSRDGTVSCASCHALDRGGVDGRRVSTGIRNQLGPINSPTVLNARFNVAQFWDGRAADLAEQAGGPITNPLEMGNGWDTVIATLSRDPSYVQSFGQSYSDGITPANVRDAIAAYEHILLTPSRFDRYLRGASREFTAEEREGAGLFVSVGCTQCHSGVNVGGGLFQRMGVRHDYFAARGNLTEADNGRFNVTRQESDRHVFKVPTLRNVALTAPYFHDGAVATLDEAVRAMAHYQLDRTLTDEEVSRISAFLRTLTGELPAEALPPTTAAQGS
jgi:cytochrome c peroxidase